MKMAWLALRQTAWADEVDFVGPRVRTAPWAWVLLLLGLLACAWVWPTVTRLEGEMADAQQTVKRLQRAAHQARVSAQAKSQPAKDAGQGSSLSPDAARHAAQLAQWLAYPWLNVLEQVEVSSQTEQAVMLSFSLDLAPLAAQAQAAPEVRVVAAIKDDDAALRWANAQGLSAQLLTREKLATPFVSAAGAYNWRADASWPGVQPGSLAA